MQDGGSRGRTPVHEQAPAPQPHHDAIARGRGLAAKERELALWDWIEALRGAIACGALLVWGVVRFVRGEGHAVEVASAGLLGVVWLGWLGVRSLRDGRRARERRRDRRSSRAQARRGGWRQ